MSKLFFATRLLRCLVVAILAYLPASVIVAASSSSNVHSFVVGKKKNDLAFVGRGGGSEKTTCSSAVGVLDLRPEGEEDSIFGTISSTTTTSTNTAHRRDAIVVPEVSSSSSSSSTVGTFPVSVPSPTEEEEEEDDGLGYDLAMDLQSAAAETIGRLCSDLCLCIYYEPKNGKTLLHRTAGIKLAAVINGIRQRHFAHSNTTTRLTVLLFSNNGDLGDDDSWDTAGVDFLLDRLRAFYAMGKESVSADDGEKEKDTFESVDIVPMWEKTPQMKKGAREIILTALSKALEGGDNRNQDFESLVQRTYDSMGGVGQIRFDALDYTNNY